ncbi:MAG: alpha/beta hydrolase [Clostridium sp.]|nr:alpha/beta hydrolase [Clostridium sp.]
MVKEKLKIDNIPAVVWGEKSERVFIAVHGNMSNKEDTVIEILAEEAVKRGYQVLSFDLPEHGERKDEDTPCKVQICVGDLEQIMNYAKGRWKEINLFACSFGAYFSLLSYRNEELKQALFLSPVVDMERIINNMMKWFKVTPERLEEEKIVYTPIGQKLYYDYYCYVKDHPINAWKFDTDILYGSKDDTCEFDTIQGFVKKFNCGLEVVEGGEHYFHTEEQLGIYRLWIQKHIR